MEYIEEYLTYLKIDKKYSDNTIESYKDNLEKLLLLKKNILTLTKNDLLEFLDKYTKTLKNSSKAHHITVLKEFYKFLNMEGYTKENPTLYLTMPKQSRHLPDVLTEEETLKILDINLNDKYSYRDKAMLELIYSSGLRVSELLNLKVHDVNIKEATLKVMGKGSKERLLPLGDYALLYLTKYLNDYRIDFKNSNEIDYLFLNSRGSKLSRQSVFKLIKEQAEIKGIKKEVSPHTLRHSYATHLLKHGADLRSIQELLGHSSISTTQIYTHIIDEQLKEEYDNCHPHSS